MTQPATSSSQVCPAYTPIARTLHWVVFIAIAVQFIVGYAMDRFDDLLEGPVDRWFGGEAENLLLVHGILGVVILVLATARLVYRLTTGLPPWAPTLTSTERRLAHWTEVVLYCAMFLIPLTGLVLLFASGEEWDIWGREWEAPLEVADDDLLLAGHIGTHVVFIVAFLAHIGLVFKHQFVNHDGLLRRML